MIDGVKIIPLKKMLDERGAVMHMIRADQEHFQGFGEVYFSLTNPGVIKGWKLHTKIHQSMCVPEGEIKMVMFDPRRQSSTFGLVQTLKFGKDNYSLLQIPPNIWYAFKAVSLHHAIIANCITEPHSKEESLTEPINSPLIPYIWGLHEQ